MSPHSIVRPLDVSPLTSEAFRPFGEVISFGPDQISDPSQARLFPAGAVLDFAGAQTSLDILYSVPRAPRIEWLERHTNSSQAFIPLSPVRLLVAVALPGADEDPVEAARMRAFITDGYQGVNFAPRIWHHPVIPIGKAVMLAVIHRGTAGAMSNDVAELSGDIALDLVTAS